MTEIHLFMAFFLGVLIGTFFLGPLIGVMAEKGICKKCRHIKYIDWPKKK